MTETAPKKKYRLIYFNLMGQVEPVRLLFALAKVPYEDYRIPENEWPNEKPKMEWGVLPVLEFEDGSQLSQSLAILRYLGREFGFAGKSEFETAKCDEYVDAMNDIVKEVVMQFFEPDADKKATLFKKLSEEVFPPLLGRLEGILEKVGTGHLVGDGITYADIVISHFLSRTKDYYSLEKYTRLQKHQEKFFQQKEVADWIATRPQTEM